MNLPTFWRSSDLIFLMQEKSDQGDSRESHSGALAGTNTHSFPFFSVRDPFSWSLKSSSPQKSSTPQSLEFPKKDNSQSSIDSNPKVPWGAFVASCSQIASAKTLGCHFLFVPGDICRQADVLDAARQSSLPVVLERGSFLPPPDFVRALEKLRGAEVLAVEGGSAFGYGQATFDISAIALLRSHGFPFCLSFTSLFGSPPTSPWAPKWISENPNAHLEAAWIAGKALGAKGVVCTPHQLTTLKGLAT